MLSENELDEFFDQHFTRWAFRLETLTGYDVASDDEDFIRYLAGEAEPDAAAKQPWLDELAADTARGKLWQRVHVLRSPLSDYLRYECEWGYTYNVAAGEDVRILDLTEVEAPAGLVDEEFFLLDDSQVLLMRYSADGEFLGAESTSAVDRYRAARDAALSVAVPFHDYWVAHPQFWRENQVGAQG